MNRVGMWLVWGIESENDESHGYPVLRQKSRTQHDAEILGECDFALQVLVTRGCAEGGRVDDVGGKGRWVVTGNRCCAVRCACRGYRALIHEVLIARIIGERKRGRRRQAQLRDRRASTRLPLCPAT